MVELSQKVKKETTVGPHHAFRPTIKKVLENSTFDRACSTQTLTSTALLHRQFFIKKTIPKKMVEDAVIKTTSQQVKNIELKFSPTFLALMLREAIEILSSSLLITGVTAPINILLTRVSVGGQVSSESKATSIFKVLFWALNGSMKKNVGVRVKSHLDNSFENEKHEHTESVEFSKKDQDALAVKALTHVTMLSAEASQSKESKLDLKKILQTSAFSLAISLPETMWTYNPWFQGTVETLNGIKNKDGQPYQLRVSPQLAKKRTAVIYMLEGAPGFYARWAGSSFVLGGYGLRNYFSEMFASDQFENSFVKDAVASMIAGTISGVPSAGLNLIATNQVASMHADYFAPSVPDMMRTLLKDVGAMKMMKITFSASLTNAMLYFVVPPIYKGVSEFVDRGILFFDRHQRVLSASSDEENNDNELFSSPVPSFGGY